VTISSDAHEHDTGTEPSFLSQLFSTFSLVTSAAILLMAAAVGATVFLPDIYYAVADADIIEHQPREADSVVGGVYAAGPEATRQQLDPANIDERQKRYLPPKNEYLPEGEWVVIPRIGVYTQRRVTQDPDEALQEGVWQVPDFGEAGDLSKPMILAAHRFGFTWWWNSDYWEYHSFYNLPELEAGDRVEIISDQRRYVYEIYKAEEGDEITDYSADLILYTCKFLNSPVRHVRYARLLPV
jgi:sortase (surface protein transpeptidase)